MLNPFPSLLIFSFFAPTLLRIAAAIAFLYIAQYLLREQKALLALTAIPLVGHIRSWMIWFSVVVTVLVAFCLFIGYGTQWAALLGLLISLKHLVATKKYQSILPLSRGTYFLLLIICVSILLTGAGALAFDLPL